MEFTHKDIVSMQRGLHKLLQLNDLPNQLLKILRDNFDVLSYHANKIRQELIEYDIKNRFLIKQDDPVREEIISRIMKDINTKRDINIKQIAMEDLHGVTVTPGCFIMISPMIKEVLKDAE